MYSWDQFVGTIAVFDMFRGEKNLPKGMKARLSGKVLSTNGITVTVQLLKKRPDGTTEYDGLVIKRHIKKHGVRFTRLDPKKHRIRPFFAPIGEKGSRFCST